MANQWLLRKRFIKTRQRRARLTLSTPILIKSMTFTSEWKYSMIQSEEFTLQVETITRIGVTRPSTSRIKFYSKKYERYQTNNRLAHQPDQSNWDSSDSWSLTFRVKFKKSEEYRPDTRLASIWPGPGNKFPVEPVKAQKESTTESRDWFSGVRGITTSYSTSSPCPGRITRGDSSDSVSSERAFSRVSREIWNSYTAGTEQPFALLRRWQEGRR